MNDRDRGPSWPRTDAEPGTALPPLWPSLLVCAVVAAWIDLGTIHRRHHADSLLYPLISRWHWTPFYWGQDRVGMLVPWLARPVADPLANLLAQGFLNLFGGLATFLLLARYALRDAAYAIIGTLGAAAFVAWAPPAYQAMYFLDACSGVWLALGLGGLIALESRPGRPAPGRRGLGLALIVLAHWVNYTTALALGPLVVSRGLVAAMTGRRRGEPPRGLLAGLRTALGSEGVIALLCLALGAAAGRALTRLSPTWGSTNLAALDPIDWPAAWHGLLVTHGAALAPGHLPAVVSGIALLGLILPVWPPARRQAPAAWRSAGALVVAAATIWLYLGTRLWVRLNGYTYRYLFPSALMIETALLTVGVGPLGRAVGSATRRGLWLAAAAGMVAAAAWGHGWPSVAGVRADIDDQFGALTSDLIAARCTHLAGRYGRVWPAVFHAHLVLHERGEDRVIWGITGRAEATAHLWGRVPADQVRVAIAIDDPEGRAALREFGFPPLYETERRSTVRVFRPTVAPAR